MMRRFARFWLLLSIAAACAFVRGAGAEPKKRALPDYDGRGQPKTTAGDVLIWVPRVVVSPLYVVSEFVVRRPVGALVVVAERDNWPEAILDFFSFDKEHTAGVFPSAFVDFGFRPSVGLYFYWNRALAPANAVRVNLATGGKDWFSAIVSDRYAFSKRDSIAIRGEAVRRSDYLFYEPGPESRKSTESRYEADRLETSARLEVWPLTSLRLRPDLGLRRVRFREGACCGDPSVFDRIRAGQIAPPPGLEGYDIAFSQLEVAVDSRVRAEGPAVGTGVRLELEGGYSRGLGRGPESFVRYGGGLGGFLDLTGKGRVLSLSGNAEFVDPSSGDVVPFTELVRLGGRGLMRGFRPGRLIDRSAAVVTLQYEWPVWAWLDGNITVSAGNVFGEHLSNFDVNLTRMSATIGMRVAGLSMPGQRFEILTGIGTDTWKDGFQVSSFRLVVGTTEGF